MSPFVRRAIPILLLLLLLLPGFWWVYRDYWGMRLVEASSHGDASGVRQALRWGADPRFEAPPARRSHTLQERLLYSVLGEGDSCCDTPFRTALGEAISRGTASCVGILLGAEGGQFDEPLDETELASAVGSSREPLQKVMLLLDHRVRQSRGEALGTAVECNRIAVMRVLLEARAGSRPTAFGLASALFTAADSGNAEAVALLLNHGAEPTRNREMGLRPIEDIMPTCTKPIRAMLRKALSRTRGGG